MNEKILIAIPAFNEEKVIGEVISSIKKEGFNDILIVDDCSKDKTFAKAKKTKVKVIKHVINRGTGAATNTGLQYAKNNNYDFIVFLDSDGQHSPKEIKKLLKFAKDYDVVIGSRMISNIDNMPTQRKIANFIGSFLTLFFFGKFVWDSQSGFKIFNKKAIKKIHISFDRFEFCSEIIGEISRHNLTVKEIPIKVAYTNHSMEKGHGQSITNGFKMILKFLFKKNKK